MNISDLIKKELESIKDKFNNPNQVISEFKAENENVKRYEGRQFLELIQNADDAGKNFGENEILIDFSNNKLIISNTGTKFSFEGVTSLLYAHNSPKDGEADTIGHYGLGFRSILSWANSVKVFSDNLALEFSKLNAIETLIEISSKPENLEKFSSNKHIVLPGKGVRTDDVTIPILPNPKIIDSQLSDKYATKIIVDCKTECIEKINKAIYDLNPHILIFLKYIHKIDIKTDKVNKTFEKITKNNGKQIITREIDTKINKVVSEISWDIYEESGQLKNAENKQNKYEFKIAFDPNSHTSGEYLYSYFKTDIKCSLPCVLHATLNLDDSRNNLVKDDDSNKELIKKLSIFMANTAETIAIKNKDVSNYDGLSILNPELLDERLEKDYSFKTLIYNQIENSRLFPTINDEYIKLHGEVIPKFSTLNFGDYLNKQDFYDLLKPCSDESIIYLLKHKFNIEFYSANEISKKINDNINWYSLDAKNQLILLFSRSGLSFSDSLYPTLLENTDNKVILLGETVYSTKPSSTELDGMNQIPTWTKVTVINSSQRDFLIDKLVNSKGDVKNKWRELTQNITFLNIKEFNSKNFADVLLKECNSDPITKEKIVDLINYLYKDLNVLEYINKNNINLLDREGKIVNISNIYFGKEYENELGETILKKCPNCHFLADSNVYGINDNIKNLKLFWEKLGVKSFPIVQEINIDIEKFKFAKEFWNICWPDGQQKNIAGEQKYKDRGVYSGLSSHDPIILNCNIYFDVETTIKLLKELPNEVVISWISNDLNLLKMLENNTASSDSFSIKIYKGYKYYQFNDFTSSFIKYLFQNVEWINIAGIESKFKPIDCCQDNENIPNEILPGLSLNNSLIKKFSNNADDYKIKSIYTKLGIPNTIADGDINFIYKVLLRLPNYDRTSRKYGRTIYNKLKTYEFTDAFLNNDQYKEFKAKGEVLAKRGEKSSYISNSNVFYSDNKIYSKEFLSNIDVLEVDARAGEEKISKIFCVKPLKELLVTIDEAKTKLCLNSFDSQFQHDYNSLLPYIVACRPTSKMKKQCISLLKSYKINLINSLNLKYYSDNKWKQFSLDNNKFEYFFDKNNKQGYITVNPDLTHTLNYDSLKSKILFADSVASLICDIIMVSDIKGEIRTLYQESKQERDWKIQNDRNCTSTDIELIDIEFNKEKNDDKYNFLKAILGSELPDNPTEEIISSLSKGKIDLKKLNVINFENISKQSNLPFIIDIIKSFGKDVCDINPYITNKINVIDFNKQIFEKYKFDNWYKYMDFFYKESPNNFDEFWNLRLNFETCESTDINSVNYSPEQNIMDIMKIDTNNPNWINSSESSINQIYENNLKKYEQNNEIDNLSILDTKTKFCYVIFNRHLDNKVKEESKVEKDNEISLSDYVNDEVLDVTDAVTQSIGNQAKTNSPSAKRSKGAKTKKYQSDISKKNNGKIGELAVYNALKKEGKNVFWVSQFSKEITGLDGNDECGYDMFFIENNKKYFIEVKSTSNEETDIHFNLSTNELKFAEQNPNNYYVYFVLIKNGHASKILNLKTLFNYHDNESFINNTKFDVIDKSYEIHCKVKEI